MTEVDRFNKTFGAMLTIGLETIKEHSGYTDEEVAHKRKHERNSKVAIDVDFTRRYLEIVRIDLGLENLRELGQDMGIHYNTILNMFPKDVEETEWTIKTYCLFIDWVENLIYESNRQHVE